MRLAFLSHCKKAKLQSDTAKNLVADCRSHCYLAASIYRDLARGAGSPSPILLLTKEHLFHPVGFATAATPAGPPSSSSTTPTRPAISRRLRLLFEHLRPKAIVKPLARERAVAPVLLCIGELASLCLVPFAGARARRPGIVPHPDHLPLLERWEGKLGLIVVVFFVVEFAAGEVSHLGPLLRGREGKDEVFVVLVGLGGRDVLTDVVLTIFETQRGLQV
mmetsp:Transcript_7143/g.21278  ORF Transcript_7143/g.21278 Transcript_7143/m.21278 type:complete len:220 (-) Transcript_7143:194-853(-)